MARNVLRAGHDLVLYARHRESARPLYEAGARNCASPRELGERCDVICTVVTSSADVEQIVLGANGLIEAASSPQHFTTLVDFSTIAPLAARRIASRLDAAGIDMLDAPVSGGEQGAINATLSIMVGGKAEALERVRPLLRGLGKTIVHVGASGAGQIAKACNQMVMVAAIQACAEAMRLCSAAGVDCEKVREAMAGGSAGSRVLDYFGAKMVRRDFAAGVEARLHHKDFGLLMAEAFGSGVPAPIAAAVWEQLNALMAHGWGAEDTSRLLAVLELAASTDR